MPSARSSGVGPCKRGRQRPMGIAVGAADATSARLLASLRAMPPSERAAHLAELALLDPEQARFLVAQLEAAEPSTIRVDSLDTDVQDAAGGRYAAYQQRRALLLDEYWRGRRIGDYTVTQVLGQGGMGIVLAATADTDGRPVAIKMVRPDLVGPGFDGRLKRESEALSRLDHPGITAYLGLGATDDGRPFLVMQRVDGQPLDQACQDRDLRGRIQLLASVCAVVAHAHAAQVVHRDLKPSNVLVDADGGVHLLDFGIAKSLADQALLTRTLTAERMLTPRYAAPEQIRGEAAGPAADVHALGVMLVELATPASADGPSSPASLDDIPRAGTVADEGLRAIATVALSPDPADRYADAGTLAADLQAWLDGQPPGVTRWRHRLGRRWRAYRRQTAFVVGAFLALAALAGLAWYDRVHLERPFESGFGLIERDLAGLSSSGKAAMREAFRRDAGGDRDSAIELVQALVDGGSDHALPITMLAIWTGARGEPAAAGHLAQARTILARSGNAYLPLFLQAYGADGDDLARQQAMEAALALRPSAWKMRFGLAHLALGRNDARRAREALAGIEFPAFDDRRVPQVLADRALLGDCAAVRPLVARLPEDRPIWRLWVTAACDFSEGRHGAARAGFARILADPAAPKEPATLDTVRSAQLLSLGQEARWAELLDAAADGYRRANEQQDRYSAHRDAIMALVAARQLRLDEDVALWRQRVLAVEEFQYQLDAHLTVRLLGLPSDFAVAAMRADAARDMPQFPGLPDLLAAVESWQAGDGDAARRALARARREGLDETRFAPTLLALERALGVAQPEEAVMLWFAPWSDWVASWVLPRTPVGEGP